MVGLLAPLVFVAGPAEAGPTKAWSQTAEGIHARLIVAVATDARRAARARLNVHTEHDCIARDRVAVVPMRHFGPHGLGGCP